MNWCAGLEALYVTMGIWKPTTWNHEWEVWLYSTVEVSPNAILLHTIAIMMIHRPWLHMHDIHQVTLYTRISMLVNEQSSTAWLERLAWNICPESWFLMGALVVQWVTPNNSMVCGSILSSGYCLCKVLQVLPVSSGESGFLPHHQNMLVGGSVSVSCP